MPPAWQDLSSSLAWNRCVDQAGLRHSYRDLPAPSLPPECSDETVYSSRLLQYVQESPYSLFAWAWAIFSTL